MDETTDGKMCPVLTTEGFFSPCLKEQCAWWSVNFELCAFTAMALALNNLALNKEREHNHG